MNDYIDQEYFNTDPGSPQVFRISGMKPNIQIENTLKEIRPERPAVKLAQETATIPGVETHLSELIRAEYVDFNDTNSEQSN